MYEQQGMLGILGVVTLGSVLGRLALFALAILLAWLFSSPRFLKFGLYVVLGLVGLYTLLIPLNPVDGVAALIIFFAVLLARRGQGADDRTTTFGSSRWARWNDIEALKLFNDHGFWLGRYTSTPAPRNWLASLLRRQKKEEPRSAIIRYQGDRHLLTCAPTRSGKGVSSIIPTLLTYEGSALVIDPKAENAIRTAEARQAMGQKVHLIDPWGLTRDFLPDIPVANFNPLDWIVDGHPDALDNAMLLADALVMTRAEAKEPFWDDEARALIAGIILHVATSESEEGHRNMGRVRDMLSADIDTFEDHLTDMSQSHYAMVSGTAARTASKEERVRSNVMATAQSHTHWLENEAMGHCPGLLPA